MCHCQEAQCDLPAILNAQAVQSRGAECEYAVANVPSSGQVNGGCERALFQDQRKDHEGPTWKACPLRAVIVLCSTVATASLQQPTTC